MRIKGDRTNLESLSQRSDGATDAIVADSKEDIDADLKEDPKSNSPLIDPITLEEVQPDGQQQSTQDQDKGSTGDGAVDTPPPADSDSTGDTPPPKAEEPPKKEDAPPKDPDDLGSIDPDIFNDTEPKIIPTQDSPATDPPGPARDYTPFDQEDIDWLKKTPNALFSKYSERIKQWQQQVADKPAPSNGDALPDSYYQHPDAYTLSPKYADIVDRNALVQDLEGHYQQQLVNIKQGKAWTDVTGKDADGNYTIKAVPGLTQKDAEGNDVPVADTISEVNVQQKLQKIGIQRQQVNNDLEALRSSFSSNHTEADSRIQGFRDKIFSKVDFTKDPFKSAKELFLKSYPSVYRDHPSTSFAAEGYAVTLQLISKIASLNKELTTLKDVKADKKAAGPGSADIGDSSNAETSPMLDPREFEDLP